MIARVAESCFWLNRYLERLESTARLLGVHRSLTVDLGLPDVARWRPVIIVAGEATRFAELHGEGGFDDGDVVQDYLTWDDTCPASIIASMRGARESARMIREIISVDMWEALNDHWHWLRSGPGRRLYRRDRDDFFRHIRNWPHLFYGLAHALLMHERPFDFMRLGMLLERTAQTARLMDVQHHLVDTDAAQSDPAIENASWLVLLHTCSALEPFYRRHQEATTARNVAEFLLLERGFPRSIAHGVDRSWNFLRRIRADLPEGERSTSAKLLKQLRIRLERARIEKILSDGLHDELTHVVDTIGAVCNAVHADYFALHLPQPTS